jgi:hypothetical protein
MCRVLVEYGTRAPSPHNAQPWRFEADRESRVLRVFLDRSRSMLAIDPFGHEAHIALGGAIENICQTLVALGCDAKLELTPIPENAQFVAKFLLNELPIEFESFKFPPVLERRTHRGAFTETRVPEVFRLEAKPTCSTEGVELRWLNDNERSAFVSLTLQAPREFIADQEQLLESDRWVRHGSGVHVDGLTHAMQGIHPVVVQIANRLPRLTAFASHRIWHQRTRDVHLKRTGSVDVLFGVPKPNAKDVIAVGRALQRVALLATQQALSVHVLNQVFERRDREQWCAREDATVGEFERLIPSGGKIGLVAFRVGYPRKGSTFTRSPRRPISDVLEMVS